MTTKKDPFWETVDNTSKEFDKKETKIKTILTNPRLFDNLVNEISKIVEGEKESIEVIMLCAYGGRLVQNCQMASFNLLINDFSGVGKDFVTNHTLSLLPYDFYVKKTRISPTVFTYLEPKTNDSWDGTVFYTEDISETVLNSEVFKVMASSGSNATVVINQKAVDIQIQGKPILITTTASATPSPELIRRFVILNLDSSQQQTKAIMKRHSRYKKEGHVPKLNIDFRIAMSWMKRYPVKIPYSDLIDEHFPSNNYIMRTNYPRFLDFICAATCLHQFSRKSEGEFLIAQKEDYELARKCFLKLFSNKFMISLTINQKKILERFEKVPNLKGSAGELLSKMGGNEFLTEKSLRWNMRKLHGYGFLSISEGRDSYNKPMQVFSLAESYKPNEELNIPKYSEITTLTTSTTLPSLTTVTTLTNNNEELGKLGKLGLPIVREEDLEITHIKMIGGKEVKQK